LEQLAPSILKSCSDLLGKIRLFTDWIGAALDNVGGNIGGESMDILALRQSGDALLKLLDLGHIAWL
jgi:hypothetical protein